MAEWLERRIEIRRSRVQLMRFSVAFNFSATLVNSQLVCLPPVGILNLIMFISIFIYHCLFTLVLKSPNGEWPITYTHRYLGNPSLKSCIRPRDLKFTLPLLTNVLAN